VAQLDVLAEQVRAAGLAVDLTVDGTPFPLGAAAELTAYRIVQEALTNTIRHASARHVRVAIRYAAPDLHVRVADDGTATPSGRRGHGIDGMRERAALHAGTLRAGPVPGEGWLVTAILRPGQSPDAAVTDGVTDITAVA
jgi:signal transduction histidine kinase